MTKDDLTADPSLLRVAELMPELMALLHRDMAGETLAIMHEAGITLPQMVAMHILRHLGGLSIGALGEKLSLSTSATSHLVDRLVGDGLVVRTEDPDDRRQKRVELAEPGRALIDQLGATRAMEIRSMLMQLSPELLSELVAVAEKIILHLRESGNPQR